MIKSNIGNIEYNPKDVIRIVNPKQCMMYIKNNIFPVDIYTSVNEKTGAPILVMIFMRDQTAEVYKKWCNYELD